MDSSFSIRKKILTREVNPLSETHDVVRAVGVLVLENPFIRTQSVQNFEPMGEILGSLIIDELVALLPSFACSYGKGAIIGQSGSPEHGAMLIHPSLGKPIREALGGGKAIIPSNVKVGLAGTAIDVPLSNKDDAWSFDHLDTVSVVVADAPRADEIMLVIALSTGKRPSLEIMKTGLK